MRIKKIILPGLLLGMSGLFFNQAVLAYAQFSLRWRFTLLMVFTGLIIIGLAAALWRNESLQKLWFDQQKSQLSLFVISSLMVLTAALFPAQAINYVNVDNTNQNNSPSNHPKINIQSGEVVDLPQGSITLLDWLKLFSGEDMRQYQGKEINVTGFLTHNTSFRAGQFSINRMTLTCCIADPVPVGLGVEWKEDNSLTEGSWIQVQGTVNIINLNGESVPEILASRVDIISQPLQPYLFPK